MAEIRSYPFSRHLRSNQSTQTLLYKKGALVREGRGLALWFRPLTAAIAEVPLDDREVTFLFRGRTADFQEAVVQGVIAYRVVDAKQLAERIDFTINLERGTWNREPLEQLSGLLTQLAQEVSQNYLAQSDLVVALRQGVDALRGRLTDGLMADALLAAMGVEVTAVRVATVQPTAEMDKALQTPTRESLHQQADEATFARRAQAVDKERAIEENELANRIELARREQQLITEEGENARRRATDEADAQRIVTEAAAEKREILSRAEAQALELMEKVRVAFEGERLDAFRDLPPLVLMMLTAKEVASGLGQVEHLYLTPDILGPIVARFMSGVQNPVPVGADV